MRQVSFASWSIFTLAYCLLVVAASPGFAQEADPFNLDFSGGLFPAAGEQEPVVSVTAQVIAPTPEQPAGLFIRAQIKPGWHIYSLSQPSGGPVRSRIDLNLPDGVEAAAARRVYPQPQRKPEPAFDNLMVESHYETVTWYVPLKPTPGANPDWLGITGELTAQPCDANGCLAPQPFLFSAVRSDQAPLSPDSMTVVSPPPAEVKGFDPDSLEIAANEQIKRTSMALMIALAFVGGMLLNLMPCVLPVIGLKVLSFVEQAGHSRRQALMLNVWYSLGLMSVFLILATLAAGPEKIGWGQLFQNNGFNISLAAVVFVMALSFLGVWEIPIPGFVGSGKVGGLAQKEGIAGAFSKGVITTILATPCTGPFMASALTWTVGQPPVRIYAVFVSIGLGMASPYLLIGAFPELVRFLPKPGAWMETFKQIMGFVLLGTVVYIFTFIHWPYVVPTIGLLFGLWGSCWWINRAPPTAQFALKARAWLEALTFAVVIWIVLFPGIDEILPGQYSFGGLYDVMQGRYDPGTGEDDLPWQPFSRPAFEQLTAERKTILIDFTADWCMTCKTLEKFVLNTPEVRRWVDENGVVTLHADWTHREPEVTAMLELLGSKQVPVLAIFPAESPNRPMIFRGGYTQQTLLEALREAGPSQPGS